MKCKNSTNLNSDNDGDKNNSTERWKRSSSSSSTPDFQLLPGTQWCGRGFSAKEITQLGAYTGADNCCRRHDLGCPFYIEAFQEKYGLFNWRPYTINHCTCDERYKHGVNEKTVYFFSKEFFKNLILSRFFYLFCLALKE